MNELNVIIATLAAMGVVGLAWLGGYRLGLNNGTTAERALADRRVRGVIDSENKRKPRQRKRLVYRKVDARSVGKKRYLNSRLPGVEVIA